MIKKYCISFLFSFILITTIIPVGNSIVNNIQYRNVSITNPYDYYNYSTMTQALNELYLNKSYCLIK